MIPPRDLSSALGMRNSALWRYPLLHYGFYVGLAALSSYRNALIPGIRYDSLRLLRCRQSRPDSRLDRCHPQRGPVPVRCQVRSEPARLRHRDAREPYSGPWPAMGKRVANRTYAVLKIQVKRASGCAPWGAWPNNHYIGTKKIFRQLCLTCGNAFDLRKLSLCDLDHIAFDLRLLTKSSLVVAYS